MKNPMLMADFYKISHRLMYPENTETVYSTWTSRASRLEGIDENVVFGQQRMIKKLMRIMTENFFQKPKAEIVRSYSRIIKYSLGVPNPDTSHIEALHDLGYLPLLIKAIPEGTVVPTRTPVMTVENTDKRFFWLTNFIESWASCELWQPATSATIARSYRKILDEAALTTVGDTDFVQFQGHDFSMRGMSSLESACSSGLGHLLSFVGTDTIPAIEEAEEFYNADVERELVGTSIPATEHSIQCAYGNDMAYFNRLITEVHPTGFVSIVSDGYDFWNVIGSVLPALKDKIMARDGRVVIRPDSGDPVKIVCGDPDGKTELERKGAVEALWDIFGGTVSKKGYKILDSHIGLIYGDAITRTRAKEIIEKLKAKGFASINCVFGIGSYTYQYNTRDSLGYAMKSTSCTIAGDEKQIFKDPKTDNGIKKSQKGRVAVLPDMSFIDGLLSTDVVENNQLRPIFENGKLLVNDSLATIRERLKKQ